MGFDLQGTDWSDWAGGILVVVGLVVALTMALGTCPAWCPAVSIGIAATSTGLDIWKKDYESAVLDSVGFGAASSISVAKSLARIGVKGRKALKLKKYLNSAKFARQLKRLEHFEAHITAGSVFFWGNAQIRKLSKYVSK